jgi:hypothetical protein
MENWDKNYCNMEVQAHVTIDIKIHNGNSSLLSAELA